MGACYTLTSLPFLVANRELTKTQVQLQLQCIDGLFQDTCCLSGKFALLFKLASHHSNNRIELRYEYDVNDWPSV